MGKIIDIKSKLKRNNKKLVDWSEFTDWEWDEVYQVRDLIQRLPLNLILTLMTWCRNELKNREEIK